MQSLRNRLRTLDLRPPRPPPTVQHPRDDAQNDASASAPPARDPSRRNLLHGQELYRPHPRDEPAIAKASVALLEAVEATSRLDHDALAADPKVAEAKAAADAVGATLAELRKVEVTRVSDNPAFAAARDQLRQASAAYDPAAGDLARARQQQAAAQSQKDDADIETKRRQMFGR